MDIHLYDVESSAPMMLDSEFFEPLIGLEHLTLQRMKNMFLDNMSLLKLERLKTLVIEDFATNSTLNRYLLKERLCLTLKRDFFIFRVID